MEVGDIVFVDKRVIRNNGDNIVISLPKNTPYIIKSIKKGFLTLNGSYYHEEHFKKWEVIDGKIRGNNIFKKGDKVTLFQRGMIGNESEDYTLIDEIEENVVYTVNHFEYMGGDANVILNKGESLHSNHFKKVVE